MFKKMIALKSPTVFAALALTLTMVGTAGCSSISTQPDAPSAEVPASAPSVDDTVSNSTSSGDLSASPSAEGQAPTAASTQTSDAQAPLVNEPVADTAPSSLGASSSGRGH